MKNNVVLSVTSSTEGKVTGKLNVLRELTLTSVSPLDIKAMLLVRDVTNFVFMGSRQGIHCSFPLTISDLYAVASLAEDAEQVLFIAQLHENCTLALDNPQPRSVIELPLVSCQLDSECPVADTVEFLVAAPLAGWTQDEIEDAVEKSELACEMPSEIGDMLYLYSDASLKEKYLAD